MEGNVNVVVTTWTDLKVVGPGGNEHLFGKEVRGGVLVAVVKSLRGYHGAKLITTDKMTNALTFVPGATLADLMMQGEDEGAKVKTE